MKFNASEDWRLNPSREAFDDFLCLSRENKACEKVLGFGRQVDVSPLMALASFSLVLTCYPVLVSEARHNPVYLRGVEVPLDAVHPLAGTQAVAAGQHSPGLCREEL